MLRAGLISTAGLLGLSLFNPAYAHHPFGMGDSTALTPWQGLLSGIGHPLLGPDHFLFLLAIAFIGLQRPRAWVIPLLAAGLGGSVLSQFIPLPEAVAPAEALVPWPRGGGFDALTVASTRWLLPLVALHGFRATPSLAEPTPLLTYFLGLLIGQGALLGGDQLVQVPAGAPRLPGATAWCRHLDRHRYGICLGGLDRLIAGTSAYYRSPQRSHLGFFCLFLPRSISSTCWWLLPPLA